MKAKQFLLLAAALLPIGAWAGIWQDPGSLVNYEYSIEKNEAYVKAGLSNSRGRTAGSPDAAGSVTIRSSITVGGKDYTVTRIDDFAFVDNSNLTGITIPESVTHISPYAFIGCSNLASIKVNPSNRFYDSRELEIDSHGRFVRGGAECNAIFYYDKYWDVNTLQKWESVYLVAGCKKTEIPSCVDVIEGSAFAGHTGLTSIEIPNSVKRIGYSAFEGCSGLTSVTLSNSLESIDLIVFKDCISLTSISIPNSVTSIGSMAFSGCTSLTSVVIPKSVTSINDRAFYGCSSLTSVTVGMVTPVSISSLVFTNRKNATLYVPKGSKQAYENANYWKEFKEIVEIGVTLPGDLNGDDAVDVTDVVELIDMVLAGIYDPAGDINGDDAVDVTDVVELIDMVLADD